jgi:hypothetical protein
LQVQVAEQTQDFYRRTDPAKTWSCNDYPSRLKKTLESYGSLSASPEDVAETAGQSDYGTRHQQQQPLGDGESGRWRSAAIDAGTTEQTDYRTHQQQQQQQHRPFPASAAHAFEQSSNGVQGASSSGEAVAVHQDANAPPGMAEDPLMLVDWSNWGLQSLFPQDPVPMGNELFSDWFH